MPEWLKKKISEKTWSERELSSAYCHFRSVYMHGQFTLALYWQFRIALVSHRSCIVDVPLAHPQNCGDPVY